MNYLSVKDIDSLDKWVKDARELKESPLNYHEPGSKQDNWYVVF